MKDERGRINYQNDQKTFQFQVSYQILLLSCTFVYFDSLLFFFFFHKVLVKLHKLAQLDPGQFCLQLGGDNVMKWPKQI